MAAIIDLLLLILAGLLALPLVVFWIECMAALWPARRIPVGGGASQPVTAVLIPAHNEAQVIGATLEGLLRERLPAMQIVVVADNCSDETARIAAGYPQVEVLERHNAEQRGKGFALAYGLAHLNHTAPEVVVMLDADCRFEPGGLQAIVEAAVAGGRPAQAVYLQHPPANPTPKDRVSAFAFLVKNLVRPLGLHNLRQPVLLTGSGMAFPWATLRHARLASGNIVEDMQLGYDLALAGTPPLLVPHARVWGELPQRATAATSQRTRWEHGHIQTLTTNLPRLLGQALRQRRFDLAALALDLTIPPLSLLVLLWLAGSALALLSGMIGLSWDPLRVLGSAGLLLFAAVGVAWMRYGRTVIQLHHLLTVPVYILWKLPLYGLYLVQRQTRWVRTERD